MRHLDLISDDDAFLLVFIRIFIALMSNEKKNGLILGVFHYLLVLTRMLRALTRGKSPIRI